MSIASAKGAQAVGLRDAREPGHCWTDNEIYDVFGPEIGQNGIHLYNTMTRLCWGAEVRVSLREIAEKGRMSRGTVDRTMKVLIAIGLIEVSKPDKVKASPVYRIVNAKRLAARFVAQQLERRRNADHAASSVPPGDSDPAPLAEPIAKSRNTLGPAPMPTLVQLLCPTGGQSADEHEAVGKNICPQDSGTDLSHGGTNLSQTRGPFNTQDTRLQDQVPLSRLSEPVRLPPLGNPEIATLVTRIVVTHPRSVERMTRWGEVTPSQQRAVLRAMDDEVEAAGCSPVAALEMILARVEAQASESPPDQRKYFKDIEAYFRLHEYRLEPATITRKDKPHASANRHANRAQQRTDSQLDALRRADAADAESEDSPQARGPGRVPEGAIVRSGTHRVLQGA